MSDTLHIISVSGGKDSTALYCWAIDQFGKDGFRAVFADTGHEHPVTLNYVRNLHEHMGYLRMTATSREIAERIADGGAPFGLGGRVHHRENLIKAVTVSDILKRLKEGDV